MKTFISFFVALVLLLCAFDFSSAYTYNKETKGPLTVDIIKPEIMENVDAPLSMKTILKNSSGEPLTVSLHFSTIETITLPGAEKNSPKSLNRNVSVPANGEISVYIKVLGSTGTLSMHYPVYLKAEWTSKNQKGEDQQDCIEVVQPFESTIHPNPNWPSTNPKLGKLVENAADLPKTTIPAGSGLMLQPLSTYRAFCTLDKESGQFRFLPVGWMGNDEQTRASVNKQPMTRSGVPRASVQMHPSYQGGPGTVGVEYRVQLPDTNQITFSSFGAMRDVNPPEPPTDGVTFIVSVIDKGRETIVTKKHITTTDWEPIEAPLGAFAGKDVIVRLTSDPGPKRNTTCDSCFWGDPIIFAGKKPDFADQKLVATKQAELLKICEAAMKSGKSTAPNAFIFALEDETRGVVVFGDNGFLDGKIAVGTPEKFVIYDGVQVTVKDAPIGQWPTTLAASEWKQMKRPNPYSHDEWTQNIQIGDESATMTYSLKTNGPALQLSVDCS
ncbi:MAG: hypothetical protein ACRCUY_14195, partial [Thermoguttaceae bacterium]